MVALTFLITTGLASQAMAACTRAMLQQATAEYIDALAAGKTTFGSLSAGTVAYHENDAVVDITKGVLSQGIKIDFNRSIYDTTLCASYTEIVGEFPMFPMHGLCIGPLHMWPP